MTTKPICPDEFESLVRKNYRFLIDDFDFAIRKENDWALHAESRDTRVSIQMEYGVNLVVEIEPIGEGARQLRRQNVLPESITLLAIIKYYNPKLKYQSEINDLPVELEKQAVRLREHCAKILWGDYSDWKKIKEYLHEITYGRK